MYESNNPIRGSNTASPLLRRVLTMLGVALLMFVMRNALTKNYSNETKSYLKSVGEEDVIDRVVPKTYEDYSREKKRQQSLIDELVANVTQLRHDVDMLQREKSHS